MKIPVEEVAALLLAVRYGHSLTSDDINDLTRMELRIHRERVKAVTRDIHDKTLAAYPEIAEHLPGPSILSLIY